MALNPKKSTVWIIWTIVMAIYGSMNAFFLKQPPPLKLEIILGWGIVMPILTNLVWWIIAFRLRFYFNLWWVFGISTAVFVGAAGFVTMWVASNQ